jgi:hypothetical protein
MDITVFFKRNRHFGGIKEERNTFRSGPGVLGAFAQIRRATISFVISVRPSVRPVFRPTVCTEQLGSYWTDFHEILYLSLLRKSVKKIQDSLKSNKMKGMLHEDQYIFLCNKNQQNANILH